MHRTYLLIDMTKTVSIVGSSDLAGTIAFAIIQYDLCKNIVLIDHDNGSLPIFTDIDDCSFMNDTNIILGDWKTAGSADVIIFAYDSNSTFPPEEKDISVTKFLKASKLAVEKMKPFFTPETILMVANYPSDIFTKFIYYWSELPASRVFGIGTMLDTMRLKRLLAEDYEVPETSIPLFVYGVERENTLVTWLNPPNESGKPAFKSLNVNAAHLFAMRKGHEFDRNLQTKEPFFAVSAIVVTLLKTVLNNETRLCTVTFYQPEFDVTISYPILLTGKGVTKYTGFFLDDNERITMDREIVKIKASIAKYKLLMEA